MSSTKPRRLKSYADVAQAMLGEAGHRVEYTKATQPVGNFVILPPPTENSPAVPAGTMLQMDGVDGVDEVDEVNEVVHAQEDHPIAYGPHIPKKKYDPLCDICMLPNGYYIPHVYSQLAAPRLFLKHVYSATANHAASKNPGSSGLSNSGVGGGSSVEE